MKKKIILGVTLFLMLLTLFALSVNAASTLETWDISATSSDSVTATLYSDYSLVISGQGNMKDWKNWSGNYAPWYSSYRSKIKSVTIENGVTNIGFYAFEDCSALTSVVIGDSVTSIGDFAFEYSYRLTSVVIPDSVTSIGVDAFSNCNRLTIYCEAESKPSTWQGDWNYSYPSYIPVVWGYAYETVYLEDIYTFKGYSFNEMGGFAVGFEIDYDALAKYEEKTGKTASFGVVAVATDRITDGKTPLEMQGTVPVINAQLTGIKMGSVSLKVTGFSEAQKSIQLTMALYVITTKNEESSIVYLQSTQCANPSGYSIAQYEADNAA
jgi:hypothetical protein